MMNACQGITICIIITVIIAIIIMDFKKFIPEMMTMITLLRLKDIIQPNNLSFWFASSVHS